MVVNGIILVLLGIGLGCSSTNLKRIGLRGLVAISVIAALASGGRAVMIMVASVQPATFLILMCGMGLGPGAGFVCGVLVALISSFLTSIGPWTIWQALVWGLVGASGYCLKDSSLFVRIVAGLAWGFLFGWIMNLWYYTEGVIPLTLETFAMACVSSFLYDLGHGVCNAVLLMCLSNPLLRIMKRWLNQGPLPE